MNSECRMPNVYLGAFLRVAVTWGRRSERKRDREIEGNFKGDKRKERMRRGRLRERRSERKGEGEKREREIEG